jgi:phosphoinositide 3-/4-kinase-like protein
MIRHLLRQAALAGTLLLSPAALAVSPASAPAPVSAPPPATLNLEHRAPVAEAVAHPKFIALQPGALPARVATPTVPWPSTPAVLRKAFREGQIREERAFPAHDVIGTHEVSQVKILWGQKEVVGIKKGPNWEPPSWNGTRQVAHGPGYVREVLVPRLAEDMGHGLETVFPPTEKRHLNGRDYSIQLVVPNGKTLFDYLRTKEEIPQLDRVTAEKLRVFDYVIGNSDRHGKNLLVFKDNEGGGKIVAHPIGIDNGLSIPEGSVPYPLNYDHPEFRWPTLFVKGQTGPLRQETKDFIGSIDPEAVAKRLNASDVNREAAVHTLRRIQQLKQDPSFLELRNEDFNSDGVNGAANLPRVAVMAVKERQNLDDAALKNIDQIVDKFYHGKDFFQNPPVP